MAASAFHSPRQISGASSRARHDANSPNAISDAIAISSGSDEGTADDMRACLRGANDRTARRVQCVAKPCLSEQLDDDRGGGHEQAEHEQPAEPWRPRVAEALPARQRALAARDELVAVVAAG